MKITTIFVITLLSSTSAFAGCISTDCEQKLEKVIVAAERGNMQAGIVSAISMLDKQGKYYDSKKALRYLNRAKQSENGVATWVLSMLYREGNVVEQDIKKADYLSALAKSRGVSDDLGTALFSTEHYEGLVSAINLYPKRTQATQARNRSQLYIKPPTSKSKGTGFRRQ
ncbi:hypothetical protein RI845_11160 [Thalassotalea nanhaiensis]|uniref:Sel1 repeat family protein n=1 Tax=Thalassotalea nanhaiensis TaxID=3065648 RepID=A0ABY9TE53_9GAMM|nr:hypothetical protein RI845_11160 [Colwelliaceae bacterium SQ345]